MLEFQSKLGCIELTPDLIDANNKDSVDFWNEWAVQSVAKDELDAKFIRANQRLIGQIENDFKILSDVLDLKLEAHILAPQNRQTESIRKLTVQQCCQIVNNSKKIV